MQSLSRGEPVTFEAKVKDIGAGSGVATAVVTDYFGAKKSFDIPVQTTAGASTPLPINLGKLDPDYYDLKVTLSWKSETGEQKGPGFRCHCDEDHWREKEIPGHRSNELWGGIRLVNRDGGGIEANGAALWDQGLYDWKTRSVVAPGGHL